MIDALPIHSFQKTTDGVWRERLVDVAMKEEDEILQQEESKHNPHGHVIGHRKGYTNVDDLPQSSSSSSSSDKKEKKQRFRFVLPPDTTPALRTLLHVDEKTGKTHSSITYLDDAAPGDIIEVNPDGMMLVQDMAAFIEDNGGGAALIIDYGEEGSGGDTLRGFKKHKQVHPLSLPGWVDVTADVDFGALKMAVNSRKQQRTSSTSSSQTPDDTTNTSKEDPIVAFGPISHCHFLASMGAPDRVVRLIEQDDTTDEQAQELFDALERLMHPDQMGERYKVLAIGRKKDGIFHPPGF